MYTSVYSQDGVAALGSKQTESVFKITVHTIPWKFNYVIFQGKRFGERTLASLLSLLLTRRFRDTSHSFFHAGLFYHPKAVKYLKSDAAAIR